MEQQHLLRELQRSCPFGEALLTHVTAHVDIPEFLLMAYFNITSALIS